LAKDPAVYDSAEAAAQAILDALAKADRDAILAVLGDKYADELFTDEESRERDSYKRIVAGAKEVMQLRADDDNTRVMVIGKNAWPMPIPIVKTEPAGVRYGGRHRQNLPSLSAGMSWRPSRHCEPSSGADPVCQRGPRRRQSGICAEVISTEGRMVCTGRWRAPTRRVLSGRLSRAAEYVHDRAKESPMGYYYRIITRQGDNPPGGRYDYVINGNMIAGFAAIAVPAEYAETGVMTFMISHQGKLYEKDLGDDTALIAAGIQDYNPDGTWTVVKDEE
jgi:hypothetical protein